MKPEFNFTDFILTKFSKTITSTQGIPQLIARYQTLAILYINFFFLSAFSMWKLFSLAFGPLPGDEVTVVIVPIQTLSLLLMKNGQKDLAALTLLITLHIGNFMVSRVCNITLGASFFMMIMPGLSYFVSSSKKIQLINLAFCVAQNIGHMLRLNNIFEVTFTDEQRFQIFSLFFVSMLYVPLSWSLFAFQKHIETDLWQVAQLNYEKAEKITKELVEAVESKDKVVSSFSHEIRNPLNSLNGSIDYLLKAVLNPEHKKVLKNAQLSGEVLINLVNNILDAAKLKSEKMEIACAEANPADVIKKVLSINSEIITQKNITARAYIQRLSPHQLYIDGSRLLQVVMNLFCNAVKFTNENGKIDIFMEWLSEDTPRDQLLSPFTARSTSEYHLDDTSIIEKPIRLTSFKSDPYLKDTEEFEETKFITHSKNISHLEDHHHRARLLGFVRSHTEWMIKNYDVIGSKAPNSRNIDDSIMINRSQNRKGFLKIQITDSGCGIANENISKLFHMFSQVEIRPDTGGTGLGLWISKQLCQKMGGDIVIYSKVGQGTTAVFYIAVDNNSLPSYNLSRSMSHGIDKVRALVVDDFSYNRDVHKLILEREGVEVSLAHDGKEACEKYMSQNEGYFSFILMDIQMPVMDGITAAHEIRKFEAKMNRKQIEIYFVSGNYYSKAEAFGTFSPNGQTLLNTQFLRKPIDMEMIKKISDKYSKLLERNT